MVDIPIKSLYLHYPFCKNLCNYCDFYKGLPSPELEDQFEDLFKSMFEKHDEILRDQNCTWSSLSTLYIGGGTPSLWGEKGAKLLSQELKKRQINLEKDCEFTIEVNPGDWDRESIDAWMKIGVNRFSVGIQSLDSTFLKVLDRVHSIDEVYETLELFKELNVNYSVDFMLGLPFSKQYKRDVIKELEEILEYGPTHISLYILTVKDNYKHFEDLPDDEFIEREYLSVSEYLKSKGFDHYEVSNFAKTQELDRRSKHNLNYWRMESVAAIGPSATGFLADRKYRYKWKTKSDDIITEVLSDKEYLMEKLYMSLRINEGLDINFFNDEKLKDLAFDLEKRDLAQVVNEKIILTSKGFLILDSIMDNIFKIYANRL